MSLIFLVWFVWVFVSFSNLVATVRFRFIEPVIYIGFCTDICCYNFARITEPIYRMFLMYVTFICFFSIKLKFNNLHKFFQSFLLSLHAGYLVWEKIDIIRKFKLSWNERVHIFILVFEQILFIISFSTIVKN